MKWLVAFEAAHVRQNIRYFRNAEKIEPIVLVAYAGDKNNKKVWAYAVCSPGTKPGDVREAHWSSGINYSKDDRVFELTAARFEELKAQYPANWYREVPPLEEFTK